MDCVSGLCFWIVFPLFPRGFKTLRQSCSNYDLVNNLNLSSVVYHNCMYISNDYI